MPELIREGLPDLKLRAVRANGDFDTYWPFHLNQERHRVHHSRYLNDTVPQAA